MKKRLQKFGAALSLKISKFERNLSHVEFEDQINSVVLMTMGGGTCSASLINNVEEDLTPYVLTAEHCLSGNANNYNFYFKYQSTSCNGSSGSYQYSMTGSSLRAVGEAPDFALLELDFK